MVQSALPFPPRALIDRVALHPGTDEAAIARFDDVGRRHRDALIAMLPDDWSFEGKRVLDFGCGSGRALRHFTAEAEQCEEFLACDIHGPSIDWLDAHLAPFRCFRNEALPPLPLPDDTLDLVYAVSVFSHLTDSMAAWLLELRRVLRPDGLLLVTFQGPARWAQRAAGAGLPPIEVLGQHVDEPGATFFDGHGPHIYLAPWWVREHWSRAFDILALHDDGMPAAEPDDRRQGRVLMRPNGRSCTPEELTAPRLSEAELTGAVTDRRLLLSEVLHLRALHAELADELAATREELDAVRSSRSWRWTAPARALRHRFRRPVT